MKTFFLGANTRKGFYSLYDGFPPDGTWLHVIKGGPGTGKSSLMRRIGQEAEKRGLEVQRVLCSGDPDSLDGICLPALGQAWADGTAPHVLEPKLLGVTGDYLDLGAFLACPFSARERAELLAMQEAYRERYREAYALLADCAEAGGLRTGAEQERGAARRAAELRQLPKDGAVSRCFLHAISCKGLVRSEEFPAGWESVLASAQELQREKEQALKQGYQVIDCLHPLDPTVSETVLLPEEKLCLELAWDPGDASRRLLDRAIAVLREAKAIHDRMEERFREHMDFDGISELTEKLIARLFA